MKHDLAKVIKRVSSFLNCPVPEDNMKHLVEHLSFDSMKKNAAVNKQDFVQVCILEVVLKIIHERGFTKYPSLR